MGEIVCFLLTNKRNVRFFPLSSCWPILFYLILRVKRNMSISVGVVGNTTMNSPFFSIFPADVLLTVALIQQRNIIVFAAVRRRVAIDFRPLPLPVVCHLRLSSTTPSSTEPGKNQLRTKNIPIYFIRYTPLPPPFDRDFRPSRGAAAAALFSLQRFASPTSGPPSLSQVLLRRVSVARFHESFHAFPSHLGDGPPFRFPRSPFIDRLDFESTPLVDVRAPTALDHFPPRGRK